MAKFISIDEQLKKAKNFLSKGDVIEAENCFQSILNKYPKNIRALEGLKTIRQSSSHAEVNFNQYVKKLIVGLYIFLLTTSLMAIARDHILKVTNQIRNAFTVNQN